MTQPPLTLRRWKRAEYEQLVDLGLFQGDSIELIGGQLVVAEPQGAYHASAVTRVDSEPEPDLVVVPGRPGDYHDSHPAHPALAIEVAESSLELDRQHKGSLYARAGIGGYWIVNLVDRVLEVYRNPGPDPSAAYAWRYRSAASLRPPDAVVPLAFPSSRIAVADLLP